MTKEIMKHLNLFAQIAKIDEARREVWGVATSEIVDKDGEVFDYQSSKPYFKSWSDEISKATDGKSLGNVREMHEPSAVGKLVEIGFDDELKEIRVIAKIIDDHAWQKCTQGVYTGFSIGGAYVNAWKEGEHTRYTARPVEISVVDNPCNPGAHFTAVKADGTWEVRKFIPRTAANSFEGAPAWRSRGDQAARSAEANTEETTMEKIGARHSAETQAHHEAIQKCMSKIADSCVDAQNHVNALLGKDDADGAARPGFTKSGPSEAESAQADNSGKQTIGDQALIESAPTIVKVATLEKSVAELRSEMQANLQELGQALTNLAEAVAKLTGDDRARAARTAVPVITVRKEDDSKVANDSDETKSVHELVKQALQKPQRASYYLR
jgi:hypothetical protein